MTPTRKAPTILVADDDELTRELTRDILVKAGFTVLDMDNGADAVATFEQQRPNAVIMDVMMPKLDGFSACQRIRRIDPEGNTPIIMTTGLDDVAAVTRAFDLGATDFITKPIHWALFTHRVRYALRAAQTAADLRLNQHRLTEAQRIAKLGHFEAEGHSRRLTVSGELMNIFGIQSSTPVAHLDDLLEFVHIDYRNDLRNAWEGTLAGAPPSSQSFRLTRPDGSQRVVFSRAERISHPARLVAIVHDITEQAETAQRLDYITYYDAVTELPNRTLLLDRMDHAVTEARRHPQTMAVVFIDLDRFKTINESYGHELGNKVLHQLAQRLRQHTRDCDTLARISGDEFVLFAEQLSFARDASRIATQVLNVLKQPLHIEGKEFVVTASLGIATYPMDGMDSDTLLSNAEAAMYQAKKGGRDGFQFFTETMNGAARERLSLETQLRRALENNEFLLCYQPQIRIDDGKLWGAEALIRWKRPGQGIVAPDKFIPILEDTGLILEVGRWVLATACTQILNWQSQGFDMSISVNLSARQFQDAQLVDSVLSITRETGVDPRALELELTESTLMANQDHAITLMRRLKDGGIQLAIDDFGTGYSSLSYLKKLPVDHLKVDKSFVINMAKDQDDRIIVQSTIDLAHNLGLSVIAEGIENIAALQLLKEMNCEVAQGYFIGRPLEPSQFDAWLSGYSTH